MRGNTHNADSDKMDLGTFMASNNSHKGQNKGKTKATHKPNGKP